MLRRAIYRWSLWGSLGLCVLPACGGSSPTANAPPATSAAVLWRQTARQWRLEAPRPTGPFTPWLVAQMLASGRATVFPLPPLPVKPAYLAWVDLTIRVGTTPQQLASFSALPTGCKPQTAYLDWAHSTFRVCIPPPSGTPIMVEYTPSVAYAQVYDRQVCARLAASAAIRCAQQPLPRPAPGMMP